MPGEPGVLGSRGTDAYKDAFASRDGGGRGYSYGDGRRDSDYAAHSAHAAAAESSAASQLLSSFVRVALEGSLREPGGRRDWSSSAGDRGDRGDRGGGGGGGGGMGGGMGGGGGGGGMGGGGAQRGFRPAQSASWVRERLLGGSSNAAAAARADMHAAEDGGVGGGRHLPSRDAKAEAARRSAEEKARRRAAQSLSWSSRPAPPVEVEALDRLEATFRSRLGLLASSMCSSPRAAGWLLGGCDPTRSGQVG